MSRTPPCAAIVISSTLWGDVIAALPPERAHNHAASIALATADALAQGGVLSAARELGGEGAALPRWQLVLESLPMAAATERATVQSTIDALLLASPRQLCNGD